MEQDVAVNDDDGLMPIAHDRPSFLQVEVGRDEHLAGWVVGPEDDPPVLLIAGAGADHRGWRAIVPE